MRAIIREIKDEDHAFILSTWLKSYYDLMVGHKPPKFIFFKEHQKAIKGCIKEGSILCNDEDPDQIIGYVVHSGTTLHYIYVKNVFRNLKLARQLLDSKKFESYTHHTSYMNKLKLSLIYNPYLFKEGNND